MKTSRRDLSVRVLLCACALLFAALLLVACSGDDEPFTVTEGYSLSGKITLDGENLSDVEIFVNGESAGLSDGNGVFSLTGLNYGDEVAFSLDGYSFSPSSVTVKGTVNDLAVRASLTSSPPVSDDDPEVDDPDDEPDTPQGGDDPAPVTERLSSPSVTVSVEEDKTLVTLVADLRATAFTFSYADGSAATVTFTSTSFALGGHTFAVTTARTESGYLTTVDVSPLRSPEGGAFTFVCSVSAQGYLPSDEVRAEAVFSPAAPRFLSVTFDPATDVLSWTTTNAPVGCSFRIYADGVLVGTTSDASYAVGNSLAAGEYVLTVALVCDDIPAVFSDGVAATVG